MKQKVTMLEMKYKLYVNGVLEKIADHENINIASV